MSGVTRLGLVPLLITKSNTAGPRALGGGSVTVTPGHGVYSSWVQVVSSASSDQLVTAVDYYGGPGGGGFQGPTIVDVGIGGSGSETVIGTAFLHGGDVLSGNNMPAGGMGMLAVPLKVAAGTRVAIRAFAVSNQYFSGGVTQSTSFTFTVVAVPYGNVEGI